MMPPKNQRQSAEENSAFWQWTVLTAIAVFGSVLLAWVVLIILSVLQS